MKFGPVKYVFRCSLNFDLGWLLSFTYRPM